MNEGTINAEVTMGGAMGVLLVNRYRVLKQLGQGGMGSVWLAEDTKLDGRKVAVKMLPSILVSNKRAYAQVKQEALVSLKLTHSNIVAVRAFEEEGGTPFLVMDYIEGRTLDDYLAEKGKLGEEETVGLLKPVAAALDYAHSQGVVHRDVKPGNVMIDKSGHPYVLDFGIAREVQETMTRVTGKLSSGTLMYMSPEQLHGAAPKSAQDVYSFAAMVYECLKGEPPFSRGQIEYQIEHDAPEPLPRHIAICRGVMAGLGKTPEARPATCAAVLTAGAENVGATRSVASGTTAHARRTLIATVLLGVLVVGALVVGGWWWQARVKGEELRVKDEALAAEQARKAEETKMAEAKRVVEEKRRVELLAFQLSAKVESAHELMGREPEDVRSFFETEIRAFENDRKAGESAKALSRNVAATNFFTAALAKATELKEQVKGYRIYFQSLQLVKEVRERPNRFWGKEGLARCDAEMQKALFQASEFARKRQFVEAVDTVKRSLSAYQDSKTFVLRNWKNAGLWAKCLEVANEDLGRDPNDAEAAALKMEAEKWLAEGQKRTAATELNWSDNGLVDGHEKSVHPADKDDGVVKLTEEQRAKMRKLREEFLLRRKREHEKLAAEKGMTLEDYERELRQERERKRAAECGYTLEAWNAMSRREQLDIMRKNRIDQKGLSKGAK